MLVMINRVLSLDYHYNLIDFVSFGGFQCRFRRIQVFHSGSDAMPALLGATADDFFSDRTPSTHTKVFKNPKFYLQVTEINNQLN